MKFSASQSSLIAALSPLAGVIPGKTTMPVLAHFHADLTGNILTLAATDLEVSMINRVEVSGEKDGKALLPARRLLEILRELPDVRITIDINREGIIVLTDKEGKEYCFAGEKEEQYPKIPDVGKGEVFKIKRSKLRRMISKASFAVSRDELRPQLTGLLLQIKPDEMRVVSTDGHRLVKIIGKLEGYSGETKDFIVPAKAMQNVQRIAEGEGDVEVYSTTGQLGFRVGNLSLVGRLIEGRYPNYEAVIPTENKNLLKVDLDALQSAVRRAAIFSNEISRQIRLSLNGGELKIQVEDVEQGNEGHESVPCEYKGEPMEIGYNAGYVLDMLKQIDTGEVVFELGSATSAGVVKPAEQEKDEELLMLIMPVRLN